MDRFAELFNSFCPTGEGGGVDPSCSPKGSTPRDRLHALRDDPHLTRDGLGKGIDATFDKLSPKEAKAVSHEFTLGRAPKSKAEAKREAHRVIETLIASRERTDFVSKADSLIKADTRTSEQKALADKVSAEIRERAVVKPTEPDHPSKMVPRMWTKEQ